MYMHSQSIYHTPDLTIRALEPAIKWPREM